MQGCETLADVRAGQPIVTGMFLYGAGINGGLDLPHGSLEFDELCVGVMVSLDFGLQPPVPIFADLVHDKREWGGIGCDALEEPGGDDVRGSVAGDGRKSLELMRVDGVVRPPQGALNGAGTGDALDVTRQEFDAVRVDPEVGDTASVLFDSIRALLPVVSVGGGGTRLLVYVVLAAVFQLVDPVLHGLDSLVGCGEGDLLCPEAFVVGGEEEFDALGGSVSLVHGRLGNLLCKKECHFG